MPTKTEGTKRTGYYLLNTDGGMANDGKRMRTDPPGRAAVAYVLRDSKDRLAPGYSDAKAIGNANNDVAEYTALVEGLRFARKKGVANIRVYLDSEFVVEQMNDRAKAKQDDTKQLRSDALKLAAEFDSIRISWIPRERNKEADGLVREILYPK